MEKRLSEVIYQDYLDTVENPTSSDGTYTIRDSMREKIIDMFSQPAIQYVNDVPSDITPGSLYLMFINDLPIYYVTQKQEEDNIWRVLKASTYYEISSYNDLITTIDNTTYSIELWNFFYLEESEIRSSIYVGKISDNDIAILEDYINGTIQELPPERRGLTPISETSVQSRFHEREAEIVREFSLRGLKDLF